MHSNQAVGSNVTNPKQISTFQKTKNTFGEIKCKLSNNTDEQNHTECFTIRL